MPSLEVLARELGGYVPVVDPRRTGKPQIIYGTNFLDDVDGPRSAFANVYRSFSAFDAMNRVKVGSFRIDDFYLYFTPTGIFVENTTTGYFDQLLSIQTTKPFWPWTIAFVGNLYYVAQYNIGLFQYEPSTNTLTKIVTPIGDAVKYLTESYGRLIYLGAEVIGVSAQDDGTNLTPAINTGAQLQPLSILSKNAFGVYAVADGVVCTTDKGLIKGTFVQASYIYAWDVLSTAEHVFSPNAAVYIPDIGLIILDEAGLHATDGAKPTPWEQAMGEYLFSTFIRKLDRTKLGCVAVFYSLPLRTLFVSFAPNAREGFLQNTFVYYVPSGHWGVFSQAHYGIVDFIDPATLITSSGFMNIFGYFSQFQDIAYTEVGPMDTQSIGDLAYHPVAELLPIINIEAPNSVEVYTTDFNFVDYDPSAFQSNYGFGLYTVQTSPFSDTNILLTDEPSLDTTDMIWVATSDIYCDQSGYLPQRAVIYRLPQVGLNSVIDVGPFRFAQQQQSDETSMITSLVTGISPSDTFSSYEDYNSEGSADDEDWNALADSIEDWGSGSAQQNIFDLFMLTTDDGITAQIQGYETLFLINAPGAANQYSCEGYSGLMHRLRFSATNPGQSFNLKYVDISGALTGRQF